MTGDEERGERNPQRLQKIMAAAGIASRRKAEELIASGRVQVNGQTVTELGTKADPQQDHIRVDGKLLKKPQQFRYFMLNKPKGVVTTVSDPEGRPTVMKFFGRSGARALSCRPVGLSERRLAADDQRRRVGQRPDQCGFSCGKDLPG